jgi:hypothetical protein
VTGELDRDSAVPVNMRHTRDYDVRIDRRTRWGNPYRIGVDGTRDEVIARYRLYLQAEIAAGRVTRDDLAALHGTEAEFSRSVREFRSWAHLRLGCWCAPLPCHGDVLAEAAEAAAMR